MRNTLVRFGARLFNREFPNKLHRDESPVKENPQKKDPGPIVDIPQSLQAIFLFLGYLLNLGPTSCIVDFYLGCWIRRISTPRHRSCGFGDTSASVLGARPRRNVQRWFRDVSGFELLASVVACCTRGRSALRRSATHARKFCAWCKPPSEQQLRNSAA